ncbi:MAG: hypothetical protein KA116_07450 [Proteobacteria bacterium]|nr:hypothetical protein [Pseudomonadota bacterium]
MNLKKIYLFVFVLLIFSNASVFSNSETATPESSTQKDFFLNPKFEIFASFDNGDRIGWLQGAETKTLVVILKDGETSYRILPFKLKYINPNADIKGHDTSTLYTDEINPETGLLEPVRYEISYFVNDIEPDHKRGDDFMLSLRRSDSSVNIGRRNFTGYFSQHQKQVISLSELFPNLSTDKTIQTIKLSDDVDLFYRDLGDENEVLLVNSLNTYSWQSFRFKKKPGKNRQLRFQDKLLGDLYFSFTYTDAKAAQIQRIEVSNRYNKSNHLNLIYSKDILAKRLKLKTPVKYIYEGKIPNSDTEVILAQYEQKIPHFKAKKSFVFIIKDSSGTFITPLEENASGTLEGTLRYFNMARGRFTEQSVRLENPDKKGLISDSLTKVNLKLTATDSDFSHQNEVLLNLKKSRKTKIVPLAKISPVPWIYTDDYECFRAGASIRFYICLRDRGYVPEMGQGQEVVFWDSELGSAQTFEAVVTKIAKDRALDVKEYSFSENTQPWFSPLHLNWFLNSSPFYDLKLYEYSLPGKPESRHAKLEWTPLEMLRPRGSAVNVFSYESQLIRYGSLCEKSLL